MTFSIQNIQFEIRGGRISQRFRGGLVFKAHRLLYHSTLGLRVIKKEKKGFECLVGGVEDDDCVARRAHLRNLPTYICIYNLYIYIHIYIYIYIYIYSPGVWR